MIGLSHAGLECKDPLCLSRVGELDTGTQPLELRGESRKGKEGRGRTSYHGSRCVHVRFVKLVESKKNNFTLLKRE